MAQSGSSQSVKVLNELREENWGVDSASGPYMPPAERQVEFVAGFLAGRKTSKKEFPDAADFRRAARCCNRSHCTAHHYHEQLAHWYREFTRLLS